MSGDNSGKEGKEDMVEGLRRVKGGRKRCGSLESLEEMWKRKREEVEEQGFNKKLQDH